MVADRHRFLRALGRLKPVPPALDALPEKLREQIKASMARFDARARAVPTPTYPEELPVSAQRELILETLRAHQVVIICGETGSGKTTQLPKMCLELGRGIGGLILSFLEDQARLGGAGQVELHAQTYVRSFYERHGYAAVGEPFFEVDIEHVRMTRRLE